MPTAETQSTGANFGPPRLILLPLKYDCAFQSQARHAAVPQRGGPESAESALQTEPLQPAG